MLYLILRIRSNFFFGPGHLNFLSLITDMFLRPDQHHPPRLWWTSSSTISCRSCLHHPPIKLISLLTLQLTDHPLLVFKGSCRLSFYLFHSLFEFLSYLWSQASNPNPIANFSSSLFFYRRCWRIRICTTRKQLSSGVILWRVIRVDKKECCSVINTTIYI